MMGSTGAQITLYFVGCDRREKAEALTVSKPSSRVNAMSLRHNSKDWRSWPSKDDSWLRKWESASDAHSCSTRWKTGSAIKP